MKIIDNWDEYFMKMAYLASYKSKDESSKIGAVLVKNNSVISMGYNGICRDVLDPWDYENKSQKFKHEISKKGISLFSAQEIYEKIKNRKSRPDKYSFVEHGERNAIYQAAYLGISTKDSILYTLALPCPDCARGIIQSGIQKVIVHKSFNDIFYEADKWKSLLQVSLDMFNEAEIELEYIEKELGEIGFIGGVEYKL